MNSQNVVVRLVCEECRDIWLPADDERWRAERIDDGPEDRLAFWCAACWLREFGT